MFMHTIGDGSKKALLIHGMASSHHTWDRLFEDLKKRDFTIYAPDLPGHGNGSHDDVSKYSVERWREMILERISSVDLLVGHSIGGLLSLQVRSDLRPQATVLADPMLHFPKGVWGKISREVFSFSQFLNNAELKHNWDKSSAVALLPGKKVPKPGNDTLIIRTDKSFVAPKSLTKSLSETEIVTLKKSTHNLHLDTYPQFFESMRDFAIRRGVFSF